MRIAILTLPLHVNFGGILQCYALQTILERKGHEVFVLHTGSEEVDYKTRAGLFVKRLIKTILRMESKFYGCKTEREIIQKYTQAFIRKYIHLLNVRDLSLSKENDFDAIVVGSDQIWRPAYYQPIANAYLKFAKDWTSVKRVAYAASFGTNKWEYTRQETEECASLLKLFDMVSVRERAGIDLCKKYLGVEAVQVLDPTLLLSKEDYLKLIDQSDVEKHDAGLFCYFLDETPEKTELVKKMAKENGWKYFQANNPNIELPLYFERRIQTPVEQWIAGFRDASFVVTDSFHGCVFSILFKKDFVAILNKERGSDRFYSLLEVFGLQDRLITDLRELKEKESIILSPVNYELVYVKYRRLVTDSHFFLKQL